MRITYSCPLEFHNTGPGIPQGAIKDAMDRAHESKKHEVYILYGKNFPLQEAGIFHGVVFDDWMASPVYMAEGDEGVTCELIEKALHSDAFVGVGCASYRQMLKVKENGGKIATTWFNTHWSNWARLMNEEYPRYGGKAPPIHPLLINRAMLEQKLCDVIITPSEQCSETYRAVGIPNVKTVNFGVNSELFHPPGDETVDLTFSVLFDGGNPVRKGLSYLLLAWNNLHFNDGMLTVMGVSQQQPVWRTKYLGWIKDQQVPETFRKSKIFCFPSLEEGQALVTLQAMASGMAMIVTRESGAPVEDGKEGLVIPMRDPQAIETALTYFHDNPSEVKKMGQNARAKAEQMPWELFGQNIIKVLEEVCGK